MFQQTQKPGKSNKQDSDSKQKKSLLNNVEMSRGHEMASMLGAPEHLRAEMEENQDPQKESNTTQLKANSENSNTITNGIVDLNSNNVAAQINAYALAHGDLHFARLHNNLSSTEGQKPAQMKEEEEEMTQAKKSGFDPVQFMIEGNKMLQAQIDRYNQTQKKSKPDNSSAADNVGTTTNLPEDVNSKMERAFESSFANVNIHKNSEKATQLGALACTQGNDLYFAPGQYNPSTVKGQELIGHELTHVVQQRDGRVKGSQNKGGMGVNADKSLEKEADVMGKNAAEAEKVDVVERRSEIQNKSINQKDGNITDRTYSTNIKSGLPRQSPDSKGGCYAYALAYAVEGRFKSSAKENVEFFKKMAGNVDGACAGVVARKSGLPFNYSNRISGTLWDSKVGKDLAAGKEVLGTINQGDGTYHWVNITKLVISDNVKRNGVIKVRVKTANYWDPLKGHVTNGKTNFKSIVCLY